MKSFALFSQFVQRESIHGEEAATSYVLSFHTLPVQTFHWPWKVVCFVGEALPWSLVVTVLHPGFRAFLEEHPTTIVRLCVCAV